MSKHFIYSKNYKFLYQVTLLFLLSIILVTNAFSARIKVEVSKIDYEMIKTPKIEISGTKSKTIGKPKNWLEIEIPLEVKHGSKRPPLFLNELMIKYYIIIDSKPKKLMLTGNITYINVPVERSAGDKIYASAYVSPASLQFLLDKPTPVKNNIKAVAVDIYYNGVIVGSKASKKESSVWWRSGSIQSLEGHVRNKTETPFSILWWDRYVEVKKVKVN